MSTLSLAMIVKDEHRTLGRVLDCAKVICDELVVVDTGSTDDTRDIARAAGAKVFHFDWVDDFAQARNFAFAQCTQDWIVWLDADDVLSEASLAAVRRYKSGLFDKPDFDALSTAYHYEYTPSGAVAVILRRERFLRRAAQFQWEGRIHELVALGGHPALHLNDVIVEHRPHPDDLPRKTDRNLRNYQAWIDTATARLRDVLLYGGELLGNGRPTEAVPVFETYLARAPADDPLGERYIATVKLADSLMACGRRDEATTRCLQAMALNPARAEAYCLLGLNYTHQGRWKQAWPMLLAAIGCVAPEGNLVVHKFYNEVPLAELARCLRHLQDPTLIQKLAAVPEQLADLLVPNRR